MPLNRRQFISCTSVSAAASVVSAPMLFAAGVGSQALSLAEIQADDSLRKIHRAITAYGGDVKMIRDQNQVSVQARITDMHAFVKCYRTADFASGPVHVPTGNCMTFASGHLDVRVEHLV